MELSGERRKTKKILQSQACSFPTNLSISSEELRENFSILMDIHTHILSGQVSAKLTSYFLHESVTDLIVDRCMSTMETMSPVVP